eukprot:4231586-Karenia_brevis.AAC.1
MPRWPVQLQCRVVSKALQPASCQPPMCQERRPVQTNRYQDWAAQTCLCNAATQAVAEARIARCPQTHPGVL